MSNLYIKKEGGYAMLTAMIFFLAGSLVILGGVASPTLNEVRLTRELVESKNSYSLAEGLVEDIVHRIKNGTTVSGTETLIEGETSVSADITGSAGNKTIRSVGNTNDLIRNIEISLVEGDGIAFNYGVQADVGGLILENFSSINGNIYSNGIVIGNNNNSANGDVISVGPLGLIEGINVAGDAHAHSITDSTIVGDAYYFDVFQNSIAFALHPNSPDLPPADLPITDELIDEWKNAATSTVVSSPCPYLIEDDVTIGPLKITCDVEIKGNIDVILNGAIWVIGDLKIEGTPDIIISSSIGDKSIPIVVDNPNDRLTSSRITLQNSTSFVGSPLGTNSYILLVSQNNSAENGGSEKAITAGNSVNGDLLLYAGHGEIELSNNVDLKEVSGYRIRLKNSAEVTYESGLADSLFTTGPSGGYTINSWDEVE